MKKPSILIVDDEANIRTALERWFQIRGFDADQAADGFAAVEKCTAKSYDIITMDLEMPGMDGVETIAQIKKIAPNTPIIVLTGFPRSGANALGNGAAKILAKPMPLRELESHVRGLIAEPAG